MQMLRLSILWLLLLLLQRTAYGQYLHLYTSPDGEPALAVYQGNAGWLAEQVNPESHLHKLKTLTALRLVQHDISLAEMRYVAGLKQLRSLTIGQAPESVRISGPAFAVLSECVWLESVWICKMHLKDSDLNVLQKLPNLKNVTIEGEGLCTADTPHGLTENAASILAKIPSLESIDIRGDAGFADRAVEELAVLPKLESLKIGSKRLTDGALKTIASKMKLRELWIASPQFSEAGILMLKRTTSIEELHIERAGRP